MNSVRRKSEKQRRRDRERMDAFVQRKSRERQPVMVASLTVHMSCDAGTQCDSPDIVNPVVTRSTQCDLPTTDGSPFMEDMWVDITTNTFRSKEVGLQCMLISPEIQCDASVQCIVASQDASIQCIVTSTLEASVQCVIESTQSIICEKAVATVASQCISETTEVQNQCEDENVELPDLIKQLDDFKCVNTELERKLKIAVRMVNDSDRRICQLRAEHQDKIRTLETKTVEIDELASEVDSLRSELQSKQLDIASLRTQVTNSAIPPQNSYPPPQHCYQQPQYRYPPSNQFYRY